MLPRPALQFGVHELAGRARDTAALSALQSFRGQLLELAHEVGDLLFAVVNLARHLRVDPERELRAASHRFRDRFHHIERRLAEQGRSPSQATLEEMDALWEEAKRLPPPPSGKVTT